MNMEQIKSAVRSAVIWVGGLVGGWALARGWDLSGILALLQSDAMIALLASAAMALWGVLAKRFGGLVLAAATVPAVSQITIEDDPELATAVKDVSTAHGTTIKSTKS